MGLLSRFRSQPAIKPPERATQRVVYRGGFRGLVDSAADMFSLFRGNRSYNASASRDENFDDAIDLGPNGSNSEIPLARARSRMAKANFSFYRAGPEQLVNNIVGSGILAIITNPEWETIWGKHGLELDIRGQLDIVGMISQLLESMIIDGEVFLVRIDCAEFPEYDCPSGINYKYMVMEADHCPIGWTMRGENGNWIKDGIETDRFGRVVAYHLIPKHPQDWDGLTTSLLPERIPAHCVFHLYKPHRPGALRGFPWGSPALPMLELIRRYLLNEAQKKAIQSKNTFFYTKPIDEEGPTVDGEVVIEPNFVNPVPGSATEVPEGWDIKFADMPQNDPNFIAFVRAAVTEIAVSFGLSVEMLIYELGQVNERGMRFQQLLMQKFFERIGYGYIVPVLQWIHGWGMTRAVERGVWKPPAGETLEQHLRPEWVMQPKGHIQPVQEMDAIIKAMDEGLLSRAQGVAAMGSNELEIDRQNLRSIQRAKKLGLRYRTFSLWQAAAEPVASAANDNGDAAPPPVASTQSFRDRADAYGIAVRAGAITPQVSDELEFRQSAALPPMSPETLELWKKHGETRQPITTRPGIAPANDTPFSPFSGGGGPEEI